MARPLSYQAKKESASRRTNRRKLATIKNKTNQNQQQLCKINVIHHHDTFMTPYIDIDGASTPVEKLNQWGNLHLPQCNCMMTSHKGLHKLARNEQKMNKPSQHTAPKEEVMARIEDPIQTSPVSSEQMLQFSPGARQPGSFASSLCQTLT